MPAIGKQSNTKPKRQGVREKAPSGLDQMLSHVGMTAAEYLARTQRERLAIDRQILNAIAREKLRAAQNAAEEARQHNLERARAAKVAQNKLYGKTPGYFDPALELPLPGGLPALTRVRGPPRFDPSLPISAYAVDFSAFTTSQLREAGWPEHIARRMVESIQSREERYGKRDFQTQVENRGVQSRSGGRSRFQAAEVASRWRVDVKPCAPAGKPAVYRLLPFRAWVDYMAWSLRGELTMVVSGKVVPKKTSYVTGNLATQALYHGCAASAAMKAQMLQKAAVFVDDYNKKGAVATPVHVMSVGGGRVLFLFGEEFTSVDAWLTVEGVMKKDKALFRKGLEYLRGSFSVDVALLQGAINAKYVVKREGLFDGAFNISHDVKVPSVMTFRHEIPLVAEIAQALAGGPENDERTRAVLSFAALVAGLWAAQSWASIVTSLSQFCCSSNFIFKATRAMMDKIASTAVSVFEGDGPEEQTMFQKLTSSILTPVWSLIATCGVAALLEQAVTGIQELIAPLLSQLVLEAKKCLVRDTAAGLVRSLGIWIQTVASRVKECIDSGSLTPLWGEKWSPMCWGREAGIMKHYFTLLTAQADSNPSALETLRELREKGVVSGHWTAPISVKEFVDRGLDHITEGEQLVSYFGASYPAIAGKLSREVQELRSFISTVHVQTIGESERVAPFMLYLYGKPGVGKTNIAQALIKALGNRLGLDSTPAGVYQWQSAVNFQDGCDHAKWAIVMDDVDTSIAPVAAGVPTHVDAIIGLVNNKPFSVEQASVDLKGKIKASPLLVTYSSNFVGGNAHIMSREPHAFYRRIGYHVTVKVKPEFSTSGGLLDVEKAFQSETHDMFDLEVSVYQPSALASGEFLSKPTKMELSAFSKMFLQRFDGHLKRQTEMLIRRTASVSTCPGCGFDTTRECGCVTTLEGGREVLAGLSTALAVGALVYRIRDRPHGGYTPRAIAARLGSAEAYDYVVMNQKMCALAGALAAAVVVAGILSKCLLSTSRMLETLEGREANSMAVPMEKDWFRLAQTFVPGVPASAGRATWTKDDLLKVVHQCACELRTKHDHMWGAVLSHNALLAPTHILAPYDEVQTLSVKIGGAEIEMQVVPSMWKTLPSNPEICVIKCSSLPGRAGILGKTWKTVDTMVSVFDDVELHTTELLSLGHQNKVTMYGARKLLSTKAVTKNGDCGSLYVASHGNAWHVVAMHYLKHSGPDIEIASGALVTQLEIEQVLRSIGVTTEGVAMVAASVAKVPECIVLGKYSVKSEILAAQTFYGTRVFPLGLLNPPLPGSSMVTKLKSSLLRPFIPELEEEFCGKLGYWTLPNFRGVMVTSREDDSAKVWESAFTNMFATQNYQFFDEDLMALALFDYMSGVTQLDTSGYATLSEEQVITGVPNSFINSINMKTSVGPPYCVGKVYHVVPDPEGSAVSPGVAAMIADIEKVLETDIPSVLALCSLKDEALKPGKMPRVFMCLPFAMNFVSKRYQSSWKSFMRANPGYFESAVGINMTSSACNDIIHRLMAVDPDLKQLYDGDIKAMDKSWSPGLFDAVSVAIFVMASAIGVEPVKNYRLALAMKHVTYSIKNDLFRAFMNPSGCDATVELNGLAISLCERYVHYRMHPFSGDMRAVRAWRTGVFENPIPPSVAGLTFRKEVALVHYGDDNLKAFAKPPTADYLQIWKKELGMIMTMASDKDSVTLEPRALSQVSFLKRRFVWDEGLGMYVPPLDLKSIGRTLVIKKDSVLSDHDHAAVAVSEALRELVYHGEETYERVRSALQVPIRELHLEDSAYLENRPYEHWRAKLLDGYQTWVPRVAPEPSPGWHSADMPVTLEGESSSFISMSNPSLVEAPHVEPAAPIGSAIFTHDVGTVSASAPLEQTGTQAKGSFYQSMPENPLAEFLTRAVLIREQILSDTDEPMTTKESFLPWKELFSNPSFLEKTRNYSYVRGSIQIIGVVTAPGASYGRYVVSALPNGGGPYTANYGHLETTPENCLQVDHSALIDPSNAANFVFQLPWVYPWDYAEVYDMASGSVTGANAMWVVNLMCLAPIRTSVAGGMTKAYVRFYACLMDDHELVVPHFEGKLKPNEAMRRYAPDVHKHLQGSSKLANAVGDAAGLMSSVPLIGPYAGVVETLAHGAGGILDWFGFTRESEETVPTPVTMRSVSNVARLDGGDASDIAALTMGNEISIDPRLAGFDGEDCFANASFFARWTLIHDFPWTTLDTSGFLLSSLDVTPFAYRSYSDPTRISLTTAGYYGLPFSKWRGDMEYRVIIPVSKLHRGALQLIWVPDGSTPFSGDVTNIALNAIFDVSAGSDRVFRVGYARPNPYSDVELTNSNPLGPASKFSRNGRLFFRVVNPLVAQTDTAGTSILVFARACANMDFAVPTETVHTTVPGFEDLPLRYSIKFEGGGALGDGDSNDPEFVELVPSCGSLPSEGLFFGERILSIRALLQKPSLMEYRTADLTLGVAGVRRPTLFQPILDGDLSHHWSWSDWYLAPFVGVAASERYKGFSSEATWMGAIRHGGEGDPPVCLSTLAPVTFHGANQGAEFTVPYYSAAKYLPNRRSDDYFPFNEYSASLIFAFGAEGDDEVPVRWYHSLGPDIRGTCFRQLPYLRLSAPPVDPSPVPRLWINPQT